MNLIVAADANWGIGKENKLLVSIPADMKFFRTTTTGNVVIMGRKTLESSGRTSLKERVNIVLTRDRITGVAMPLWCTAWKNLEEVKNIRKTFTLSAGDSIYKQMLPYCHKAHVTKIDFAYEADTFFPNLDEDKEWKVTERSEEQEQYFDIEYEFRHEREKNKNSRKLQEKTSVAAFCFFTLGHLQKGFPVSCRLCAGVPFGNVEGQNYFQRNSVSAVNPVNENLGSQLSHFFCGNVYGG